MPNQNNPENKYAWLITFLIYNHSAVDEANKSKRGYIPLKRQIDEIYATVSKLDLPKEVKIIFVEASIDVKNTALQIWLRTKTYEGFQQEICTPGPLTAMTTEESLIQVLQPIINNNLARRNIVITLGHGSIFGINFYTHKESHKELISNFLHLDYQPVGSEINDIVKKRFENNAEIAKKWLPALVAEVDIKEPLKKLFPQAYFSSVDFSEIYNEPNLSVLTVKEINGAFKTVFGEKKVDILVLDNCFMQNLFSQYELRNTVEYLVAAQSGISYPGFNYGDIIEMIKKDLMVTPEIIANAFVDRKIVENHEMYPEFQSDIEGRWCLSSVPLHCKDYISCKKKFGELCSDLLRISTEEPAMASEIASCIQTTISEIFKYAIHSNTNIEIIDLHLFLICFKQNVERKSVFSDYLELLNLSIDELIDIFNSKAVKRFTGREFYNTGHSSLDKHNSEKIGFGFLMLLEPCDSRLIDIVYEKQGQVSFAPAFLVDSDYFRLIELIRNNV